MKECLKRIAEYNVDGHFNGYHGCNEDQCIAWVEMCSVKTQAACTAESKSVCHKCEFGKPHCRLME